MLFYSFFAFINVNQIIKNNNIINESLYQKNQNFSNLTSKYKIIAIYYPDNNNSTIINNETVQNINNPYLIEEQIKLAKSHGIFGFGIMYNLSNIYQKNDNAFKVLSDVNELNFSFFIIINNNIKLNNNQTLLMKNIKNSKENFFIFLDNMQNYFTSENYIKYRRKPILGIFNSSIINRYLIKNIRRYQLQKGSEKIFILSINNENQNLRYNNYSIIK